MKAIVLVCLCIQLVSGGVLDNEVDNEVYDEQICSHNEVCLPAQICKKYEKYVDKPADWDPKICNHEKIGKKVITSICCPTTLNDMKCGKHSGIAISMRIFGGEEITPSQFPWMVMVGNKKKDFFCGGTLISNRFVLTAAHCARRKKAKYVRLCKNHNGKKYYSAHRSSKRIDTCEHQDIEVKQNFVHPKYQIREKINDIALLRLKEEVTFNNSVRPICIPGRGSEELSSIPSKFYVVGWGQTEKNTAFEVLKYAEVSTLPLETCEKYISLSNNAIHLDETVVCTAKGNKGKHCQGDSGGPLQYKSLLSGRYVQHGVVSFGTNGIYRGTGVHTRIDQYTDWIHKVVISSNT